MIFKRLGSRYFNDLNNQYLLFLFKTLKILQNRSIRHLGDFFEQRSLYDVDEYQISIELYNGKNPVVQLDAHKNRLCGVFNKGRCQFKSRS